MQSAMLKLRMSPSSFALILLLSLSLTISESTVVDKFIECLTMYATPGIYRNIYTRDNTSFSSVLQSYNRNLRFLTPETPKPIVIVTPTDVTHAQATLSCAKPLGLQVRIRSGGHDYEGLSYSSQSDILFVLLDLFNLRDIFVYTEDNFVRVISGATVGELYHRLSQSSLTFAIPAGICPTMGVGGHFGGGGYGNLARKYGLTVDNIIRSFFIDANGVLRTPMSLDDDILWAIKGGGAANFGVVFLWDIQILNVPEIVTVFNVKTTIEQGAIDIAYRWQYVAPNLPNDLFIRATHKVVSSSSKEGKYTVEVSFMGLFLGKSKPLLSLMDKSFSELGLKKSDCIETSWINSTLFWNDFPNGTSIDALLERPNNGSYFFKNKSDFVKKPIPKEGITSIWDKMVELEDVVMHWNPFGGRMSEISESATPFPHRVGILFMIEYPLSWTREGMNSTNYYLNKSKTFYDFMTPYVSSSPREAFFNYRDLDIGANPSNKTDYELAEEYGRKYFKDNYNRLVRVKTKVDPDNFLRYEQSIPPLPKKKNM